MSSPGTTHPAGTMTPIYDRLAPLYDLIYGVGLQHGRRRALAALAPRPGERVLEVGIGTAMSAGAYPTDVSVLGVDLSVAMLRRAARRLGAGAITQVSLARMDARALALPDASFDAVYAPYLINVVPEPIRAGRELRRVCRPGGRIVLLNHFAGTTVGNRFVDRLAGRAAAWVGGVDWHLDLATFLRDCGLAVSSVEPVNFAGVSCVVVCRAPTTAIGPPVHVQEVP